MLSLINVEVNARVDRFESTLWRAADIADQSMSSAAANADKFQTAFDQAAIGVGQASDRVAGNFEAANDRIAGAADEAAKSIDGIQEAADKIDTRSWQEKVAAGFGAGVGAGIVAAQNWLDKVEEYSAAKLKAIGIGLAITLVSASAAAVYTGYKVISGTLGFLTGLITGDSYKSSNIDALVSLNAEVEKLQGALQLTAPQASALNEALKSVGVSSGTYTTTMAAATKAAHENTDELDRLGIKYKDADGHLLDQQQLLENVKKALDEYTDGYDRNAAAVSIGVGNYQEISDALKVTDEQIEKSHQRLIDYNLIIGEGTQEAVTRYEDSMRKFERESELTSMGFKKAIADNTMPALTDLADFFREGFPTAVNAFRYSLAVLTTLLYGLRETTYIVTESVVESFAGVGDVISRVVSAIDKAMHGDYSGAWSELRAVPDDLGQRWDKYWGNLQAQSERNLKAMKLAWGGDTLDEITGNAASGGKSGKSWVPKPPAEKEQGASHAAAKERVDPNGYEAFVQRLQRENTALEQNEYIMLKVEAAQKAYAEGKDATAALFEIEQRQILASNKALADFSAKQEAANQVLEAKRGAIGLIGIDLDIYNMREQRRLEAIQKIADAERAGKPLTDQAREAIQAQAAASADAAEAILRQNDAMERTFEVGARKAFRSYVDDATNSAKQANDVFSTAFRSMEDVFAKFVQTGKLDFKSLADSIISELIRIQVRSAMASSTSSGGWLNSLVSTAFSWITGSSGNGSGAGGLVADTAGVMSSPVNMSSGVEVAGFFANGGDAEAGKAYIVGEHGRELLFMGDQGGRVVPGGALSAAEGDTAAPLGDGGSFTVNVNVKNDASADGYQATASAKQNGNNIDVELLIQRSLLSDLSRNGPVSKGLSATFAGLRRAV